eukprot:INCI4004.1.p1 GENE.INCI4004.1~~INCI4004.1.p1  ORF type:complete len:291 (-),score=56.97 INCI4004.1:584-1456(-)
MSGAPAVPVTAVTPSAVSSASTSTPASTSTSGSSSTATTAESQGQGSTRQQTQQAWEQWASASIDDEDVLFPDPHVYSDIAASVEAVRKLKGDKLRKTMAHVQRLHFRKRAFKVRGRAVEQVQRLVNFYTELPTRLARQDELRLSSQHQEERLAEMGAFAAGTNGGVGAAAGAPAIPSATRPTNKASKPRKKRPRRDPVEISDAMSSLLARLSEEPRRLSHVEELAHLVNIAHTMGIQFSDDAKRQVRAKVESLINTLCRENGLNGAAGPSGDEGDDVDDDDDEDDDDRY